MTSLAEGTGCHSTTVQPTLSSFPWYGILIHVFKRVYSLFLPPNEHVTVIRKLQLVILEQPIHSRMCGVGERGILSF